MMMNAKSVPIFSLYTLLAVASAHAHFLELLPSKPLFEDAKGNKVSLDIAFGHPFYGKLLKMDAPSEVMVISPGGEEKKLRLKDDEAGDTSTFQPSFKLKENGDYTVIAKGAPYYEPEEKQYIEQISKVVINAGGIEGPWNDPVGLPIEIVPLSRPYGLWAGSSFSGMVFINGKPAPHVKVEVTLARGSEKLPELSELHDVATLYTDGVGMFTIALPFSGWWGLSAISHPDRMMAGPDGKDVPVELDGLIWIYADEAK